LKRKTIKIIGIILIILYVFAIMGCYFQQPQRATCNRCKGTGRGPSTLEQVAGNNSGRNYCNHCQGNGYCISGTSCAIGCKR